MAVRDFFSVCLRMRDAARACLLVDRLSLRVGSRLGACVLGALLAACDTGSSSGDSASGVIALTVPPILNTRAVDQENLVPRVFVNGEAIDTVDTGERWEARVLVSRGSDVEIDIIWIELVGFRELRLADAVASLVAIDRDRVIRVFADDYETDRFDADFDGISNLAERIGNSDPFNADDPGMNSAAVQIPFIDPAGAPVIDGVEDGVWASAVTRDRDGALLQVDNLLIDQGATRLDGDTEFAWKAMHDGTSLYLLFYGEGRNGQSPTFDSSPDDWNDDAMEIFIDADNSKLSDYDGVDDTHLLLPLLQLDGQDNRSGLPGTRFFTGFNSIEIDESSIEFVACACPGTQAIWEVRMNLAANQMAVDTTIGFEIQYDGDNDGGERDSKWAWFHPSRTDTDVDNSWQNPTFMSTMRLVPSLF